MSYIGNFALASTLDFKFTTRSFSTGAPTSLVGGTLAAYPNNSITEITAGITLTADFDARTGLNNVRIVATGANGYATATNYDVVITAGTVGGVSVVGEVVGTFSIENRVVLLQAATHTGAVIPTVTTVTNQLTAAQVATGVWQDAVAGDFTVANSIGKNLKAADTVPGGAAGHFIAGTNAATSITTALTANITGNLSGSVGSVTADVGITQAGADKVWGTTVRTLSAAGVQAIWDALTSALTTAGSIGLGLSRFVNFGFYQNGAVWVDTVNGTPGAVSGVNGTNRNPVSNMADANTLATALGLDRFEVAPQSSITFAAAQSGKFFSARGATIALGGQNIAGTTIFGALVSGISTGAQPVLRECFIVSNSSFGTNFILDDCTLAGTITLPTGVCLIKDCVAAILGGTPPVLDFGLATLNTQVDLRKYAGHIEIQNLGQAGTDSLFMDSAGADLTINANCIGGNVTIRGIVGLTNNGTGITFDVEQRTTPNTIQAKILSDATPFPGANIDATISSRLATAGYTVPPTVVQIADGFLDRNMATGTDSGTETIRTPRQALRILRNKVDVPLGTVYKEDDTTASWTFAKTVDATAQPITVVDPTG